MADTQNALYRGRASSEKSAQRLLFQQELHRQNHNGLLVYRDELVSLLKTLERYDNSGERGFYLTGWNVDSPYTFDRIGRGMNLHIPAVCLSLLGSTQPGRISKFIKAAVNGGTGERLLRYSNILNASRLAALLGKRSTSFHVSHVSGHTVSPNR